MTDTSSRIEVPLRSDLSRARLAEVEAQPVPRRRALREGIVDDGVLEHALDIVAGLEEGDRLDPLHHVDAGKARVAVLGDPLPDVADAGIVARNGQRHAPAPLV